MSETNGVLLQPTSEKRFDHEAGPDLAAYAVASLGEGLRLVKRETVELDDDLCDRILNLAELPYDRGLKDLHVKKLIKAMESGTFRPEHVILAICRFQGAEYRINGQHTCWARLYAKVPAKYRCPANLYRYAATSENDMRLLYASFDRGLTRSKGVVVCSYLFDSELWQDITKGSIRLCSEGLGIWQWEKYHERQLRDADDRAFLLATDYQDVGLAVARFIQGCQASASRHILRGPVVGAMLATFQKSPVDATAFWTAIRDGIGFSEKTDPRLVLRNALTSVSIRQGAGARDGKKSASQEEMYRWCVYGWNAWRKGLPIKQLKALLNNPRPELRSCPLEDLDDRVRLVRCFGPHEPRGEGLLPAAWPVQPVRPARGRPRDRRDGRRRRTDVQEHRRPRAGRPNLRRNRNEHRARRAADPVQHWTSRLDQPTIHRPATAPLPRPDRRADLRRPRATGLPLLASRLSRHGCRGGCGSSGDLAGLASPASPVQLY
jgi:hypothetical protein